MQFNRDRLLDAIIVLFPYLLIMIVIAGVGISVLMGRIDYIIRSLIITVPCAIVAVYILYKKHASEICDLNRKIPEINLDWRIFIILYLGFTVCSIISCYFTDKRDILYLLFIICLVVVVILQIYNTRCCGKIILAEIVILGLNIAWSVTLNYPLYFGSTDLLTLSDGVAVVTQSAGLLNSEFDESYSSFPLYFIFYSVVCLVGGFNPISSIHVISPLVFVLLMPCIYLLSRVLFKNEKLALLTTILYAVLPDCILYSTYVVPRVYAYFGFLLFLLLTVLRMHMSKSNSKGVRSILILELLILLYTILVHQVSIFQILCLCVFFIFLGYVLVNKWYCIPELILTLLVTLVYWIYASFGFLEKLFSDRINFLESTGVTLVSNNKGSVDTTLPYLIENADVAILLFFVLLGVFFLIKSKGYHPLSKRYCPALILIGVFGFTMLVFYLPTPLTLSHFVSGVMRADRLMLLLSPIYAIIAIAGLSHFMTCGKANNIFGIILTIFCIAGIALFTIGSCSDISDSDKQYFLDSELNSFYFIESYVPSGTTLHSDNRALRYFSMKKETGFSTLNQPYYKTFYTNILDGGYDLGYSILRMKEFEDYGLRIRYYETYNNIKYYEPSDTFALSNMLSAKDQSNTYYTNSAVDILKY